MWKLYLQTGFRLTSFNNVSSLEGLMDMVHETPNAAEPAGLVIVCPAYNDWAALSKLIPRLESVLADNHLKARLLIVNDGSETPPKLNWGEAPLQALGEIQVLDLAHNVGNQRAIAIGLYHVYSSMECDSVVVMDADGEDCPEDLPALVAAARAQPEAIVFASRDQRSEPGVFRLFYRLYKWLFTLLTGCRITFGNFSVVPGNRLESLMSLADLWNHYAAAVLRSRLPIHLVPTSRGHRLDERSHMNFTALVTHGLSAISIFMDSMAVRMTLFSLGLAMLALLSIGVAFAIRVFTDLAIPGWATNVTLFLLVIMLQAFSISVLMAFVFLSYRTQNSFLPKRDCAHYIRGVTRVAGTT